MPSARSFVIFSLCDPITIFCPTNSFECEFVPLLIGLEIPEALPWPPPNIPPNADLKKSVILNVYPLISPMIKMRSLEFLKLKIFQKY